MEVLAGVLPWLLDPRDVTSLACTCSALARAAACLTRSRTLDAARGLEPFPVPIVNRVDHLLYPSFSYSPFCLLPSQAAKQPWGSASVSFASPDRPHYKVGPLGSTSTACHCVVATAIAHGSDDPSADIGQTDKQVIQDTVTDSENASQLDGACPSSRKRQRSGRFDGAQASLCGRTLRGELAYDANGRLRFLREGDGFTDFGRKETFLLWECGVACTCDSNCSFRVTQKGLSVKVAVVRDALKGWCLRASQFISRGSFVCEYAGELLTTEESRVRQTSYDRARMGGHKFASALLVLREHYHLGVYRYV